jgi:hypothetical protein
MPNVALVVVLLATFVPPGVAAARLTVLTAGKQAAFRRSSGFVRVGGDPALATLVDPTCAGGATTKVQLGAYLQSTYRVKYAADPATEAVLDCAGWRPTRGGFMYEDATGARIGVKRVVYTRKKLTIRLGGSGYEFPGGPVGFVEATLTIGETRYLARFHNLRANDASRVVAAKPSTAAAEGERAFWAVLHGDDKSEAKMQACLAALGRAVRRNRKDGRSHFLLAMMRLYRFGLMTTDYRAIGDAAKREIADSDAAFDAAIPLLWDGRAGDSRAPGFAAATKFVRGFAEGNADLQAEGVADLNAAVAVNAFFNVFDVIPLIQALPRTDPRFQTAFQQFATYLENPETIACVGSQPEICGNLGLAPRNLNGSLMLFGDLYAKGGNLERATFWYTLGGAVDDAYAFKALALERLATVDERVARWTDDDPDNDPAVVGLGAENCATCHNR